MNSSELTNVLCQLFDGGNDTHEKMSSAMRKMAVIDAAENICEQIQLSSK